MRSINNGLDTDKIAVTNQLKAFDMLNYKTLCKRGAQRRLNLVNSPSLINISRNNTLKGSLVIGISKKGCSALVCAVNVEELASCYTLLLVVSFLFSEGCRFCSDSISYLVVLFQQGPTEKVGGG